MKICLINNLYGPFARGGAETAVKGYAEMLETTGHQLFIITTLPRGSRADAGNDKIYPHTLNSLGLKLGIHYSIYEGVGVYYLGGLSAIYFHLSRLPFFLRFIWQLANLFNFASYFQVKKILANENPDLVMTHNLTGIGFLAPLAIKRLKLRHFHFLHDIQLLHPSGLLIYGREKTIDTIPARIYQAITRRFFSSPEKVISPSTWLMREHLDRGYFKFCEKFILPNPSTIKGTDTGCAKPKPHKSMGREFKFLYVGQIEEHKGVLLLVETFIRSNDEAAELIIIGDGSNMAALEKIIGSDRNIKLLGRKKREEVLAAMLEADCLVVPSLCYENAPSVIFESLACGLPVIASRIGGIPEILDNRPELMFTPGSPSELAARLGWVTKNYPQALDIADDFCEKLSKNRLADYVKILL